MNRVALFVALVAIVPAAGAAAWVPCEQPGIEAPVPLDREAPGDRGGARRETRRFEFRLPDSTLGTVPAMQLASAPFPPAACEQERTGHVMLELRTDLVPIESVALLTLFFDPARATCPGNRSPDRDRPPTYHPAPRVTRTMKGPAAATTG